jgi:asparagine synthase (glutamine-hydrolysing)
MRLKANTTERKIILKKIAERVLPKEFDKKRKQGFGIPIGDWMRKGVWNDFFYDNLVTCQTPFFNQSVIRSLFDSHVKGAENTERLFGLLMFQLWINKYKSYL